MLAAVSISALAFGAAVLAFRSITVNQDRLSSLVDLELGTDTISNYYAQDTDTVSVYASPNYGRAAFAEEMRELFWEDLQYSSAVYCLSRDELNTVRPTTLTYDADDPPRIDTPNGFRAFLSAQIPEASLFLDYRGEPTGANASIFLIGPATSETEMPVQAVYDIDFVTPSGKTGTYASVRRYREGALTHYYDIYYEGQTGDAFQPVFVHFERDTRRAVNEGAAIDRFKAANGMPFYFVWWPDPASLFLEKVSGSIAYGTDDPREAYAHMGGRTPYFFAVPMYPAL